MFTLFEQHRQEAQLCALSAKDYVDSRRDIKSLTYGRTYYRCLCLNIYRITYIPKSLSPLSFDPYQVTASRVFLSVISHLPCMRGRDLGKLNRLCKK